MGMRPAAHMGRPPVSVVGVATALVSLVLTVAACVLAYLAVRPGATFNLREAFLAVFGLLLVVAVNS